MTKPLTYHKPSGEWGIEGVDLSTLPPQVYGALAKLMRLEHPLCNTRAEMLRLASVEEMAEMLTQACPDANEHCGGVSICRECLLNWLLESGGTSSEKPAPKKNSAQWQDWLKNSFEQGEV